MSLINGEYGTIGSEWVDWCLRLDYDREDIFWSIQAWAGLAVAILAEEAIQK